MRALVLLIAAVVASGQQSAPYSVEVVRNVMVPMRDGVRLATDLYLPAASGARAAGRFPTLVSRTPYKAGLSNEAQFYEQHGYAVVAQDVHGRSGSDGTFSPFLQEGSDGYDAIEWAARQEWSNGKVATFGASYLAWEQYRAALE